MADDGFGFGAGFEDLMDDEEETIEQEPVEISPEEKEKAREEAEAQSRLNARLSRRDAFIKLLGNIVSAWDDPTGKYRVLPPLENGLIGYTVAKLSGRKFVGWEIVKAQQKKDQAEFEHGDGNSDFTRERTGTSVGEFGEEIDENWDVAFVMHLAAMISRPPTEFCFKDSIRLTMDPKQKQRLIYRKVPKQDWADFEHPFCTATAPVGDQHPLKKIAFIPWGLGTCPSRRPLKKNLHAIHAGGLERPMYHDGQCMCAVAGYFGDLKLLNEIKDAFHPERKYLPEEDLRSALDGALLGGHVHAVKWIFQEQRLRLEGVCSPVEERYTIINRYFGEDKKYREDKQRLPLSLAMNSGNQFLIKWCLEAGADPALLPAKTLAVCVLTSDYQEGARLLSSTSPIPTKVSQQDWVLIMRDKDYASWIQQLCMHWPPFKVGGSKERPATWNRVLRTGDSSRLLTIWQMYQRYPLENKLDHQASTLVASWEKLLGLHFDSAKGRATINQLADPEFYPEMDGVPLIDLTSPDASGVGILHGALESVVRRNLPWSHFEYYARILAVKKNFSTATLSSSLTKNASGDEDAPSLPSEVFSHLPTGTSHSSLLYHLIDLSFASTFRTGHTDMGRYAEKNSVMALKLVDLCPELATTRDLNGKLPIEFLLKLACPVDASTFGWSYNLRKSREYELCPHFAELCSRLLKAGLSDQRVEKKNYASEEERKAKLRAWIIEQLWHAASLHVQLFAFLWDRVLLLEIESNHDITAEDVTTHFFDYGLQEIEPTSQTRHPGSVLQQLCLYQPLISNDQNAQESRFLQVFRKSLIQRRDVEPSSSSSSSVSKAIKEHSAKVGVMSTWLWKRSGELKDMNPGWARADPRTEAENFIRNSLATGMVDFNTIVMLPEQWPNDNDPRGNAQTYFHDGVYYGSQSRVTSNRYVDPYLSHSSKEEEEKKKTLNIVPVHLGRLLIGVILPARLYPGDCVGNFPYSFPEWMDDMFVRRPILQLLEEQSRNTPATTTTTVGGNSSTHHLIETSCLTRAEWIFPHLVKLLTNEEGATSFQGYWMHMFHDQRREKLFVDLNDHYTLPDHFRWQGYYTRKVTSQVGTLNGLPPTPQTKAKLNAIKNGDRLAVEELHFCTLHSLSEVCAALHCHNPQQRGYIQLEALTSWAMSLEHRTNHRFGGMLMAQSTGGGSGGGGATSSGGGSGTGGLFHLLALSPCDGARYGANNERDHLLDLTDSDQMEAAVAETLAALTSRFTQPSAYTLETYGDRPEYSLQGLLTPDECGATPFHLCRSVQRLESLLGAYKRPCLGKPHQKEDYVFPQELIDLFCATSSSTPAATRDLPSPDNSTTDVSQKIPSTSHLRSPLVDWLSNAKAPYTKGTQKCTLLLLELFSSSSSSSCSTTRGGEDDRDEKKNLLRAQMFEKTEAFIKTMANDKDLKEKLDPDGRLKQKIQHWKEKVTSLETDDGSEQNEAEEKDDPFYY